MELDKLCIGMIEPAPHQSLSSRPVSDEDRAADHRGGCAYRRALFELKRAGPDASRELLLEVEMMTFSLSLRSISFVQRT